MDFPTPLVVNFWFWVGLNAFWLVAAFFTHRTKSHENFFLRFQHIIPLAVAYYLIFDQHRYFLLAGKVYGTGWNNWIVYPGMLFTIAGISFTLWARIHLGRYWSGMITIKEGHKVIRTGPYAIVRHPIYTGWLVALFGSALVSGTVDGFLGLELVILGFVIKLHREERALSTELGDEYFQYVQDVPGALVPGVRVISTQESRIQSDAFNRALLQSDKLRALGFMTVCAVMLIIDVVSLFVHPNESRRFITACVWWIALAVYEGILLATTYHSQWQNRPIRTWVWVINTAIECALPTIALLGLTADKTWLGPYRALVSSSVLFYALLIILSILRLSPPLCIVAGTTSAGGYLWLYWFTLHVAPHNPNRLFMPAATYFTIDLLLFGAGLVAAMVAQQVRRYVLAAMAEAETRRKLDRMEYDIRIARSIQMGLLPKSPPTVPGYDIAGYSEPADQTGGDYYDWIELPGGRVMFTIADAVGHGIGPALLVAACRAYFRALARRDDPLELITAQVDALLASDVSEGRFITAAVALLDPGTNLLSLYSAGHAPLFLYNAAENAVKLCGADQPPLGVQAGNGDCSARVIPLLPGDALVLVTDGFFESRNAAGELLGAARLSDSIRAHHGLAANEQIAQLRQDVFTFAAGTPQADDITAVIIKRL